MTVPSVAITPLTPVGAELPFATVKGGHKDTQPVVQAILPAVSLSKTYSDLPWESTRIWPLELVAVAMTLLLDDAAAVVDEAAAVVGGAAVDAFLALLPQAARTNATPTMAAADNMIRLERAECIVISSKDVRYRCYAWRG
jgi:hypothetical protein